MRLSASLVALLTTASLVGCASTTTRALKTEGPPPPGFIRIVGEPVPGWSWGMGNGPTVAALTWEHIGPMPIEGEFFSDGDDVSGRVVSVAPHPTDPDTVYIASASGGIWKTTDAGVTWIPLTDELSILNHGFVALDRSFPDFVYAGTGEYTLLTAGDGLFRSMDAGATWEKIATTDEVGSTCSGVIVDPGESARIHVSGDTGYHRSVDFGASWATHLSGPVSSLTLSPFRPSLLLAGKAGDGIYRSLDSGDSWTKMTVGLPPSGFARVVVALSPSDPRIAYAAFVDSIDSGLLAMVKSADGGSTWFDLPSTPDFPLPQGFYDLYVGIDPTDPDTVYCGGVDPRFAPAGVIKTVDGGATWTEISAGSVAGILHPDHQAIGFGPTGRIWECNDGGVWKSDDGGATWISTNATLSITQSYGVAAHPTNADKVMAGTQDNGSIGREGDVPEWPQTVEGDGGFLAYDFVDPTTFYTTAPLLLVIRITSTAIDIISGPWGGDPVSFIAPMVMDPNDSKTLLGGTNKVWRTLDADAGATWFPISPETVSAGGVLSAIAIAEGFPELIVTGSSTGAVWATGDGGGGWFDISPGPPAEVTDIFIDPGEPSRMMASFALSTAPSRVMFTETLGGSWRGVAGTLPAGVTPLALEVDWLFEPPHIYVGAGHGIYYSDDFGATWTKDGADLPNVIIGDLQINDSERVINAATYGRGTWRADLPGGCPADLTGDGVVDADDFFEFLDLFVAEDPRADIDGDGDHDATDFFLFLDLFVLGCP